MRENLKETIINSPESVKIIAPLVVGHQVEPGIHVSPRIFLNTGFQQRYWIYTCDGGGLLGGRRAVSNGNGQTCLRKALGLPIWILGLGTACWLDTLLLLLLVVLLILLIVFLIIV